MKNGVYFIVITLLVAELFKIFNLCKFRSLVTSFWAETLIVQLLITLMTKFHDMSTVTFPWQHNVLQALSIQRG